jgi:hypothetical protein
MALAISPAMRTPGRLESTDGAVKCRNCPHARNQDAVVRVELEAGLRRERESQKAGRRAFSSCRGCALAPGPFDVGDQHRVDRQVAEWLDGEHVELSQ